LNEQLVLFFLAATIFFILYWWAFNRAITAKYATIAIFWFQYRIAIRTFVKIHTCIIRHFFFFFEPAFGAIYRRKFYYLHLKGILKYDYLL